MRNITITSTPTGDGRFRVAIDTNGDVDERVVDAPTIKHATAGVIVETVAGGRPWAFKVDAQPERDVMWMQVLDPGDDAPDPRRASRSAHVWPPPA